MRDEGFGFRVQVLGFGGRGGFCLVGVFSSFLLVLLVGVPLRGSLEGALFQDPLVPSRFRV